MKKKILYFVKDGLPTPEQKEEAAKIGAVIRNASVAKNDFLETCDAVYGAVPAVYLEKFPLFSGDAGMGKTEGEEKEAVPEAPTAPEAPKKGQERKKR
jgi:hypothetical protein